jgi:hypothetical protein
LLLRASALVVCAGSPAVAQPVEVLGTRAAGMAGAFVAVADDATAVYWNPAGLGTGDFFGLVAGYARVTGGDEDRARTRDSAADVFVGTPPLGFGYYRLQTAGAARPPGVPEAWALSRLTTHHVAIAVAQSLGEYVNVGGAVRVVHGGAGAGIVPEQPPARALDLAADLPTEGATKVDADLGVMVRGAGVRVGLVARNLAEPSFATASGTPETLDRQVRVGAAFFPARRLTISMDADLTRTETVDGDWRAIAGGIEQRVAAMVVVRGGVMASTAGDARPAVAAGASVALTSLLHVDVHGTRGGSAAPRGWGVSLRASF